MKKNSPKKEFKQGRILQLVQYVASVHHLDEMILRAQLAANFPELKDKAFCANCGGSMTVYTYSVMYLDVKLLCVMANVVTERMKAGQSFTEANKVHREIISARSTYNVASRFSMASKLGLVAKVMKKNQDGTSVHDREKGWSITTRGYNFLRGDPIPRMIKVFHNRIQEHFEDMITMKDLLQQSNRVMDEVNYLEEVAGVFVETYQRPQLLAV